MAKVTIEVIYNKSLTHENINHNGNRYWSRKRGDIVEIETYEVDLPAGHGYHCMDPFQKLKYMCPREKIWHMCEREVDAHWSSKNDYMLDEDRTPEVGKEYNFVALHNTACGTGYHGRFYGRVLSVER